MAALLTRPGTYRVEQLCGPGDSIDRAAPPSLGAVHIVTGGQGVVLVRGRPAHWPDRGSLAIGHGGGDEASRAVSLDRTLTAGDVEAIADAVLQKIVEIVGARPATFGFVDARELADELGVSIDYVYAHAGELGAMRLGSGPKARIRFDLDRARQALERPQHRSNATRRR